MIDLLRIIKEDIRKTTIFFEKMKISIHDDHTMNSSDDEMSARVKKRIKAHMKPIFID